MPANEYKDNEFIVNRINNVKNYRLNSKRKATQKLAQKPELFGEIRWKDNSDFIFIPEVSSESRMYIPMGFITESSVVAAPNLEVYNAKLWQLGILESRMHMIWVKSVSGKLETRIRYSASLAYNTFPVPKLSTHRKNEIEELVWKILDIRDEEGGTLAELYGSPLAAKNPKPMNPRLKAAHEELDQVVDRAYRDRPFKDDNERLALLLDMYSRKVNEEK